MSDLFFLPSLPTARCLMEMLITRIWNYPPVMPLMAAPHPESLLTVEDVIGRELTLQRTEKESILRLETTIERSAACVHAIAASGAEVRLAMNQIPADALIFFCIHKPSETELSLIQVSEQSSHLLSQLVLFDPFGPARQPPSSVLTSLQVSSASVYVFATLLR